MKELFTIMMWVAMTAGCGVGTVDVECEEFFHMLCDSDILYQVDLCGNTTALGKCRHGCNLDFSGCRTCDAPDVPEPTERPITYTLEETNQLRTSGEFQELPEIKPIVR